MNNDLNQNINNNVTPQPMPNTNPMNPQPIPNPVPQQPAQPQPMNTGMAQPMSNPMPQEPIMNQPPTQPIGGQMPEQSMNPQQMNMQQPMMQQPTMEQPEPPKEKKKSNPVLIFLMFVALIGGAGYFGYNYFIANKDVNSNTNNSGTTVTDNTSEEVTTEENTTTESTSSATTSSKESSELFQATVNNVNISFPATKSSFDNTGWTWDASYATKKIDSGYSATGGRIGTAPGGVVVTVINNSGELKEIQNCTIDDGTFYNPKNDKDNISFVGGLTFKSTEEQVKNKMKELNYSNPKETKVDSKSASYKYFKGDDQNNFKDYIEFSFYDGTLSFVGIFTSGN